MPTRLPGAPPTVYLERHHRLTVFGPSGRRAVGRLDDVARGCVIQALSATVGDRPTLRRRVQWTITRHATETFREDALGRSEV
jgi:hypothetical protein